MRQTNSLYTLLLTALLSLVLSACSLGQSEKMNNLKEASLLSPPAVISLKIKNYKPQPGNTFQHLFVSNFSAKINNGRLELSTARDGLSDLTKAATVKDYGFSTVSAESAVPGFLDLVLYLMGVKASSQQYLHCAASQRLSTANDIIMYTDTRQTGAPTEYLGLRDCEKNYLGLDPKKFDSAGNGIPDYLKLRCGINPLDKNAAYVSSASDGVANIDKCKRNIPLNESASSQNAQMLGYRYSIETNIDGSQEHVIANIPVLNDGQDNLIAIYVVETNTTTMEQSLYTAFAIMKPGYTNKRLEFPYWATDAAHFYNQEILVP